MQRTTPTGARASATRPTASSENKKPISRTSSIGAPPKRPSTAPPRAKPARKASSTSTTSSTSTVRPISRHTIPEEPETELAVAPSMPPPSEASIERLPRSPPKLEIRSTPTLKPQAASDAELEMKKPRVIGHSRAQSIAHGQEGGTRDMQAIQSLLRQSVAHDTVSVENKQLKAEVERLKEENEQHYTNARLATEKRGSIYSAEIAYIQTSYDAKLKDQESTHAAELEKIHAELKEQRGAVTKLDQENNNLTTKNFRLMAVEAKIWMVEEALKDSRRRGENHFQESQKTSQDRDQLAVVVEDLKKEIDKCQTQLDADVKKQVEEKQEALKLTEELREQVDNLQQQRGDDNQMLEDLRSKIETMEGAKSSSEAHHATEIAGIKQNDNQRLEELLEAAANAEADKSSAESSLSNVQEEMKILHGALETLQQDTTEKSARIEELLEAASANKSSAESSLSNVREELEGLQRVLETLQQDAAEKETSHVTGLSKLRKELEDGPIETLTKLTNELEDSHGNTLAKLRGELQESHEASVKSLRDTHVRALEEQRRELSSADGLTVGELKSQVDNWAAENKVLETKLGSAEMRHNRELEEESQKHEAAYRDLQNAFSQVKESQTKQISEQKTKFETEVKGLKDSQAKQMSEQKKQFETEAKELHGSHAEQMSEQKKQFDFEVIELKDSQAEQISKQKKQFETEVMKLKDSQAEEMSEQKKMFETEAKGLKDSEEKQMSEQRKEFETELREVKNSQAEQMSEQRKEFEIEVKELKDSQVEQMNEQKMKFDTEVKELSDALAASKEETPLAYASEDELHPKATKGNAPAVDDVPSELISKSENSSTLADPSEAASSALLHEATTGNGSATDDVSSEQLSRSKDSPILAGPGEAALGALFDEAIPDEGSAVDDVPMTPIRESKNSQSLANPSGDTRKSPKVHPDKATTGDEYAKDCIPSEPIINREMVNGTITLEGTLESIRVQTEQLLEVHDDMMAENRRWRRRLGMRQSRARVVS